MRSRERVIRLMVLSFLGLNSVTEGEEMERPRLDWELGDLALPHLGL